MNEDSLLYRLSALLFNTQIFIRQFCVNLDNVGAFNREIVLSVETEYSSSCVSTPIFLEQDRRNCDGPA